MRHQLSYLVVLSLTILTNACDSKNVTNSLGTSSTSLSSSSVIKSLNPVATLAGSNVLIQGTGLDLQTFLVDRTAVKTQSSTEQAIITVPTGKPGFIDITATSGSSTSKHVFYRLAGSSDSPVYDAEPANVCSGQKYYDLDGVLQTGTKTCAGASDVKSCAGYDLPVWSTITESWLCFSVGKLLDNAISRDQFLDLLKQKILFSSPHLTASKTSLTCADSVNAGDAIYTTNDSSFFYCQNNTWVPIALNGSSGGVGTTGAQGLTGADGANGANGSAGQFIVKDSANTTIGNLLGFSDPIDPSLSGSTTLYSGSTFFGVRLDGSLASASSPVYEVYQGANCPGAETPAIIWGNATAPVTAAPMTLAYKIGSTIYNYQSPSATPTTAARLSYKKDGGSCVNAPPGTPAFSTIDTSATIWASHFEPVMDSSGRLYVAYLDNNSTYELRIASCKPTTSNPDCSRVSGSWIIGTPNAPTGTYPKMVVGKDGATLYTVGPNYASGSLDGIAFAMCRPNVGNSYCTGATAWTMITNGGTANTLANTSGSNYSAGIAVGSDGRLFVTYTLNATNDIVTSTCMPDSTNAYCTDNISSWTSGTFANDSSGGPLVADANGRLHLMDKKTNGHYRYWTCLPSIANTYCTASGWSSMELVDATSGSLTVSPTGRVMYAYYDSNNYAVTVASCQATGASCATGANYTAAGWTIGYVDGTNASSNGVHIATDESGNAFIAMKDKTAYCLAANNCGDGSSWVVFDDEGPSNGSGIFVKNSKVYAFYFLTTPGEMHMAYSDSSILKSAYVNTVNTSLSTSYTLPFRFLTN